MEFNNNKSTMEVTHLKPTMANHALWFYDRRIFNYGTVITNEHSSWSVIELEEKPKSVWIKATRRKDAIGISYSLDRTKFTMSNLAYFPGKRIAMIGMVAASPDGYGFKATFESCSIRHLPKEQTKMTWKK